MFFQSFTELLNQSAFCQRDSHHWKDCYSPIYIISYTQNMAANFCTLCDFFFRTVRHCSYNGNLSFFTFFFSFFFIRVMEIKKEKINFACVCFCLLFFLSFFSIFYYTSITVCGTNFFSRSRFPYVLNSTKSLYKIRSIYTE